MPKYERPSYFPEKEWEDLTNITSNPNGKRAIEKAAEFSSLKDITKHCWELEQKNNPNIPINKLNFEALLSSIVGFQWPIINLNNIADIGRNRAASKLIPKYEEALTNNYNKLPKKSQQLGIKEAIKARTPLQTSDSNLNQRPQYQGGIQ